MYKHFSITRKGVRRRFKAERVGRSEVITPAWQLKLSGLYLLLRFSNLRVLLSIDQRFVWCLLVAKPSVAVGFDDRLLGEALV
jgi:hypothetical protein